MHINDFIEQNRNITFLQYEKPKDNIIYFICENDGKIIYIGKTDNLAPRILHHHVHGEGFHRFQGKSVFYFFANNENCCELERTLISKIRPKYNTQIRKTKIQKKQPKPRKDKIQKKQSRPRLAGIVSVASSKRKIKKLIRLCGSRKKAAKTANIALGYIYRLEKGLKPSMRLYQDVVKICDELKKGSQ